MTVILTGLVFVGLVMLVLIAFLRRQRSAPLHQPSLVIYRDQLYELERDIAAGKIAGSEAHTLRTEISRRLLQADRETNTAPVVLRQTWMPLLLTLIVPAIAIPVYLANGSPNAPDLPLRARLDGALENNDFDAMIAKVETHLAQSPNDVAGWNLVAPIYAQLGQFENAATAYEQLLRLEPATAERYASLGEAMTLSNEGLVTKQAAQVLKLALGLDQNEMKATFYLGLAMKQEGKSDEARRHFERLVKITKPDTPWRNAATEALASMAKAPALTSEQMQAGENMSPEDQTAMIRSMVDGLETRLAGNSKDLDGWLRLIRARTKLGERDRALAALAKAKTIFSSEPQSIDKLISFAQEMQLQ